MTISTDFTGLLNDRFAKNLLPIPATNQFPLGSFAPLFELPQVQTNQLIRLVDYRGVSPVVLAFTRIFTERHYCPLCYPHILALNQAYEQFRQRGVEVLMITSTDEWQSQRVAQDLDLKLPLLRNPDCRTFRQYKVGQALGAPLPAQFIVDRTGRIQFRHLFSFLDPNASVDRLLLALDRLSPG
ncbi:MAG TPA: peroxiredoxin family protein [Allocoleopsis sp.]